MQSDTTTTTTPATFEHTYRPPHVSDGKYSNQRRFGEQDPARPKEFPKTQRNKPRNSFDGRAEISIYRDAGEDEAEIITTMGWATTVNVTVKLAPKALRQLAAALLDAAHDIETAPAAVLAVGHTEKAGA